jgi:exportin-1
MHLIAFLEMKEESFSLIIDSIVWAFKHTMKDVAESGLLIMLELWKSALLLYFAFFASLILSFRNVSNSSSDFAGMFVRRFYLPVLSDVLFVLTDRMHKCGKCDIFLFSSSAFTL